MSSSKRHWTQALALVVFLSAGSALAYDPPKYFSLFVKGGAGDYVGNLGNTTAWGPTYGVAFGVNPLSWLGFEIAYDGSRNETRTEYGSNAYWRNGGSAMLKLSIPIPVVRPFIAGGFGLDYVSATGASGNNFANSLFPEVPVAAGLEVTVNSFLIGARATYHFMFNQGFATVNGGNVQGGMVDVQLTLGGRF